MATNPKIRPALGAGETYSDPDFLLVQTSTDCNGESHSEIDRMFNAKREDDTGSWVCKTLTGRTKMSHEDAIAMARAYAEHHQVPLIYEQHDDERVAQKFEWKNVANK